MEPVQAAAENPGADVQHEVAVLHERPLAWRFGYPLVAAPVMATCAGLLDGPWAAGFAYAVLLLGVASTWRAVLPPRLLDLVRPHEGRAVGGSHHEAAFPDSVVAWRGYVLVALLVVGSCYGLADTPGAALVAYALLLLGVGSICRGVLPPRPMERVREEDNRGVGKSNHGVAVSGAWTMAGCLLVSATVLTSWAGFIDGPGTAFFAYMIQLLVSIIAAMLLLSLGKLKIA